MSARPSSHPARRPSLWSRCSRHDIPIGEVLESEAGEQDIYQRVHVRPFADLKDFEYAQVLTGGPEVTP